MRKSNASRSKRKSNASHYDEDNDVVLPLDTSVRASQHIENMKNFRQSMRASNSALGNQRASVANTIARASKAFSIDGNTDAAALVVENERLKTTIHVLQKKLEGLQYNDDETQKLRKEKNLHMDEIDDLKTKVSTLEAELEVKVSEYEAKLTAQVSEASARLEATVSDYESRLKA